MSRQRKQKQQQQQQDCPNVSDAKPLDWNSPWAVYLSACLIVLTTIAAFSNIFDCPFVFDSKYAIIKNTTIQQLWPIWVPLSPPNQHGETVTGRPMLNLSLAVNYAISGFDTWSYQAMNLAIHATAALLLFGILRRTMLLPLQKSRWGAAAVPLAFAVALLWAIHPLQTESVTYTVQRAESLVGLFYFLTLYCFIRGAESSKRRLWHIRSALACLLGMASKEVMVSAPLVVLLYDRTFLSVSFREAWRRRRGYYLALGGTWLLLAALVAAAGNRGGSAGLNSGVPWWPYLCTQFGAIVHYLRLCAWPYPLVMDYGPVLAKQASEIVPYAVVLALLGLATLAALWRWPKIGFLGAWFFLILAPTSSVVPVATQTIAEHRMYLPLAAVLTAVALAAYSLGQFLTLRRYCRAQTAVFTGCAATVVVGLTLANLTFSRNVDYRSEISIWQTTANHAPRNARAQYSLGTAVEADEQIDKAIRCYQKAVKIDPDYWKARNNLGSLWSQKGQYDKAMAEIRRAITLKPKEANLHSNLGVVLAAQGRFEEAVAQHEEALRLDPNFAFAHNSFGATLRSLGRNDEAVGEFRAAVRLKPDYWEAYMNLGMALHDRGDLDGAIDQFRRAVKICPNHPDLRGLLEKTISEREQARR